MNASQSPSSPIIFSASISVHHYWGAVHCFFFKKLDLIIQSKSFALVLRNTLKVAYEKEDMPLCAKP